MALEATDVVHLANDQLIPAWQADKRKLDRIDRWARWDHEKPIKPRKASSEFKEIIARAQAPWGDLIVGSIAQTLYIEGYRRPDAPEDSTGWRYWQANGMDGRQVAINRSTLTYGLSYGVCLPGRNLAGEPIPEMRGVSPREMLAVYDDPANDEWPVFTLRLSKVRGGWRVRVLDDVNMWTFDVPNLGDKPKGGVTALAHEVGVCPVVRFKDRFDLEGRAVGEIEPVIPLLGRLDQTTFDRLVVQRFGAWLVRYIAGMDVRASADATGETIEQAKLRLAVEDFLTSPDKDTKFGAIPATPLDGFIAAEDADKRDLAALTQNPAFELLGQLANLSAEALAAAKASQTAKSMELRHTLGEDYEQYIRLASHVAGDDEGAADFTSQVQWADTSIRSIGQAADAYGKIATQLGVPPKILWPKLPGITQLDVQEAERILESGGPLDALLRELTAGQTPAE